MSLETDLQNAISSATTLNQTVQGQIDNINTTLTNAVANVDSTLNAATAQAASEVSTFLANGTSKRMHVNNIYVPETPIRVYGANILGADYDKSIDEDNSVIRAANPSENVDGWPMLDKSLVKNPFQEYYEQHQTVRGGSMHSPLDEDGNPCYVDLPIFNEGAGMNVSRYQDSPDVMGQYLSGKQMFLVMRIGVEGSPHRAHRTWIQTWARSQGAYNGGLYRNVASPTVAEQQQVYVNGHDGRYQIANTEAAGLNAPDGDRDQHCSIYLASASGYGFGTPIASHYGKWMVFPIYGTNQWPTVRIWNWGFGDLYISAVGIASGDFLPAV